MVSAARKDARKEREPLERRNEQLQSQLNDAELLLASHQEQLAELKAAMQEKPIHRSDFDVTTNTPTAPSTPALDNQEYMSKVLNALNLSPTTPGKDDVPPAHPTSFTHLIHPVLRTDVQAYEDFRSLLEMSRRSQPTSRVTSGTYSGLSGLGLASLSNREPSHIPDRMPSNGSTSSLSTSNVYQSSPSAHNIPTSTNSSISSRDALVSGTPLKETAFYKRALSEDIEPTLRLEAAPGLSWLARRTVISSMCEGKLIVEPVPSTSRTFHPPCSLCGEQGRDQQHSRTHRFRTNESETAQRYPLCRYCLNRVRASCDFLGFLRMIKDGHWRTSGTHAEAIAWEESVRLRERMFWSRIGGGVIPAFLRAREDTPRSSVEDEKTTSTLTDSQTSLESSLDPKAEKSSSSSQEKASNQVLSNNSTTKTESPLAFDQGVEFRQNILPSPGITSSQTSSMGSADPSARSLSRTLSRPQCLSRTESSTKGSVAKRAAIFERSNSEDAAAKQLHISLQDSMKAKSQLSGRSPSPDIRSKLDEVSLKAYNRGRGTSGTVSGAFDF